MRPEAGPATRMPSRVAVTDGDDVIKAHLTKETEVALQGGDDQLFVGPGPGNFDGGSDTLDQGSGNVPLRNLSKRGDFISYEFTTLPVIASLEEGTVERGAVTDAIVAFEALRGTTKDDTLTGDSGKNLLIGGFGDDTIFGLDGLDRLVGDDELLPKKGGDDRLYGGEGLDFLIGGRGDDLLDGGAENDFFGFGYIKRAPGESILGIDTISLFGDAVAYTETKQAVNVDLATGIAQVGKNERDTLVDIESVLGGGGRDTLLGDEGRNSLVGNGGNDIIDGRDGGGGFLGGAGNDVIRSGAGDDYSFGEAGNDTIFGGRGFDRLLGGAGKDYFELDTGADGTRVVFDLQGGDKLRTSATDTNGDRIIDEQDDGITIADNIVDLAEFSDFKPVAGQSMFIAEAGGSTTILVGVTELDPSAIVPA